jgi:transposase
MTEKNIELSRRLVVGHKRDGRSCYDKEAKRELIEACMRPGVSVARMALQHGINANLLRTWITRYRQSIDEEAAMPALITPSAFVPVVQAKAAAVKRPWRIGAQLPNGVKLDLRELAPDELSSLLNLLCQLPCSASTPD